MQFKWTFAEAEGGWKPLLNVLWRVCSENKQSLINTLNFHRILSLFTTISIRIPSKNNACPLSYYKNWQAIWQKSIWTAFSILRCKSDKMEALTKLYFFTESFLLRRLYYWYSYMLEQQQPGLNDKTLFPELYQNVTSSDPQAPYYLNLYCICICYLQWPPGSAPPTFFRRRRPWAFAYDDLHSASIRRIGIYKMCVNTGLLCKQRRHNDISKICNVGTHQ